MENIAGGKVELTEYTSQKTKVTYDNFFMYLSDFYNF
jgi:hypothetical protein